MAAAGCDDTISHGSGSSTFQYLVQVASVNGRVNYLSNSIHVYTLEVLLDALVEWFVLILAVSFF